MWQEDLLGLQLSEADGPGNGASGARANVGLVPLLLRMMKRVNGVTDKLVKLLISQYGYLLMIVHKNVCLYM